MVSEAIAAAQIAVVGTLIGAVAGGVLGLLANYLIQRYERQLQEDTHRHQRRLQDMQHEFEAWRLQEPLFRRGYDTYDDVRRWGYRLSNRFESLKQTQFQNLSPLHKEDFFVAAVKYRRALQKVPLILPGRAGVYEEYREVETAAKALVEKMITIRVYPRADALESVQDKRGTDIIQHAQQNSEMSAIWNDFLNPIPGINPDDAMKKIEDHRQAFLGMIEQFYKGPSMDQQNRPITH